MGSSGSSGVPSYATNTTLPTGQTASSRTVNGNTTNTAFGLTPGSFGDVANQSLTPDYQIGQQALQSLPTSYSVQDAFNNPYTQQITSLLNNQTNYGQAQQQNQLSNQLNAQNQMGSSYAGQQQYNLNQQYANALNQNELEGLQYGNQAYQQSIQNPLNVLQGANNSVLSGLQSIYSPYNASASYQQSAVNPLVQNASNYSLGQQQLQNQQLSTLLQGTEAGPLGYLAGYFAP
jgi:hypothetical protein